MLNKKGFTLIEIIVSFIFVSVLSISLFSIIINYRNKAQDNEAELELLSYISKVKIDVQKDIDNKLLKSMNNCYNGTDIIEQCVVLTFGDDSTKIFKIGYNFEIEKIENNNGETLDEYSFKIPFISYGGIKYKIPDGHNVSIKNDFILEKTSIEDSMETNTSLYKIRVRLSHKQFPDDFEFRIVANAASNITTGQTPNYKSYNIGDIVTIQINNSLQRKFRVIKNSSGFSNSLVLLYDDVNLDITTNFNNLSHGNEYSGSYLESNYITLKNLWQNARVVRAPSADEIAYITNLCPQYREVNSFNVSISGPAWVTSSSYWTLSKKHYTDSNEGKYVWFVNSLTKTLESRQIDHTIGNSIRPVIEINKIYDVNR